MLKLLWQVLEHINRIILHKCDSITWLNAWKCWSGKNSSYPIIISVLILHSVQWCPPEVTGLVKPKNETIVANINLSYNSDIMMNLKFVIYRVVTVHIPKAFHLQLPEQSQGTTKLVSAQMRWWTDLKQVSKPVSYLLHSKATDWLLQLFRWEFQTACCV